MAKSISHYILHRRIIIIDVHVAYVNPLWIVVRWCLIHIFFVFFPFFLDSAKAKKEQNKKKLEEVYSPPPLELGFFLPFCAFALDSCFEIWLRHLTDRRLGSANKPKSHQNVYRGGCEVSVAKLFSHCLSSSSHSKVPQRSLSMSKHCNLPLATTFFSHSKQTLFANLHPLTISLEQVEKVNFALSMIRLQRHQTMFICLFVRFDHRETCTFFTPHNRLTEQNVFGEFIYCAHANLIVKSLQLISIVD